MAAKRAHEENRNASEDLWSDCDDDILLGAVLDDNEDSLHDSDGAREGRTSPSTPHVVPLTTYRRGYLWVSDLSSQVWCEQQMVYGFTLPTVKVEDPVMTEGSNMHLARELEVQDVVQVKVTSGEDIFAIKVINLIGAVNSFLSGVRIRREIPIFGAPFGEGVFFIGMIDQVECDLDSFTFDLWEYKTRANSRTLPSLAQRKTHNMQVMLYKKLFDDLVKGNITKDVIVKHLSLSMDREFGEDVRKNIRDSGLESRNLNDLLDFTFDRMKCIPCINQLLIEYCYQVDKTTIGVETVRYDDQWLEEQIKHYISYWKGERQPAGVDVEDAWKCQRCDFADVCEWRQKKAQQCAAQNRTKSKVMKR